MANVPEKLERAGSIGTALLMYMPDDREALPTGDLTTQNIQPLKSDEKDHFLLWAKDHNHEIYDFWGEQIDYWIQEIAGEQTIERDKVLEAYKGQDNAEEQANIVMANLAIATKLVRAYQAYNVGAGDDGAGNVGGPEGGDAAVAQMFRNDSAVTMPDKMSTADALDAMLVMLRNRSARPWHSRDLNGTIAR